jgi:hypothetical protein
MMTDAFMIEVIAKRMDEECPWQDAQTVLQHRHWLDVVEHLWRDKKLRGPLIDAYATEIMNARAQQLMAIAEIDRMPR